MFGRGDCLGNTSCGDYKLIVGDVLELPDELQRPRYVLSPGARRLERLLAERSEHPAVNVAVAMIRLIDIALIDSLDQGEDYGNELITHLISVVEHLASVTPDSLLPLVDHVRSDSFSLLFTTRERDHEACEAVLRILGECLDSTPLPPRLSGETEYTSTYLFSLVERQLERSKGHRLRMALPVWQWNLVFGDGATPRNNVEDLLKYAGEREDGDRFTSVRERFRVLLGEVEQDFTSRVAIGSQVVEREELIAWLWELADRDAFYELTKEHPMFSVHALGQLFSLSQEYNLEWAVASFDWRTAVEEDVARWRMRDAQLPLVG